MNLEPAKPEPTPQEAALKVARALGNMGPRHFPCPGCGRIQHPGCYKHHRMHCKANKKAAIVPHGTPRNAP